MELPVDEDDAFNDDNQDLLINFPPEVQKAIEQVHNLTFDLFSKIYRKNTQWRSFFGFKLIYLLTYDIFNCSKLLLKLMYWNYCSRLSFDL